jgi:heat-inducible transcriptional repressor
MSERSQLNDRHRNILRTTIQHYIATAEPVGSKTLVQEYNLSISSATIRSTMGKLEKAGLLYQPHTSAGRIPSDSGYRLYVDRLIAPDANMGRQIEDLLDRQFKTDTGNLESLLQRSAQILASLSGYIALITLPQNPNTQLRHLQLVQVSVRQIMLIVVTDSYHTESVLIETPPCLDRAEELDEEARQQELQILSNFLTSKLKGNSLAALYTLNWQELDREFQQYADFLKILLQEIDRLARPSLTTSIVVRGVAEALRQPEFSQLERVQMLLHLLEVEQDSLFPLIFSCPNFERAKNKVSVKIGMENPLEPMKICTLISANYYQENLAIGSVGIIGPTRMPYESAIALVESAADYISESFS